MNKQQDSGILPWVLLAVPVLWAAAIAAYAYEDGMNIFDPLGRFTVLVERPFAIGWKAHTPKFMLVGLPLYECGAALYFSTKENRRSGAGKTRFFCKPNLMQANCSFLVTDPSGYLQ